MELRLLVVVSCWPAVAAFSGLPLRAPAVVRAANVQLMFGGGGDGGEGGGFMCVPMPPSRTVHGLKSAVVPLCLHRRDKIKQAQQMFNPEMMKKYSEVGVKVQQLQAELAQTEVECATKDSGVVVKVSGTQVRSRPP